MRLLLAVCLAVCLATGAARRAAARDLTLLAPDRDPTALATLRETLFDPWRAAGHALVVTATPDPADPPDIALVDGATLAAGCAAGTYAKLDWSALGGRDRFIARATADCGAGAYLGATILTWDRGKFPGVPSWADFWDVAKVPGKRGLEKSPRGALIFALLADGVAAGDVYNTLRSQAGADRAFRKLDQLRPYIVWWSKPADAVHILESGEVLMSSAPADAVVAANRAQHSFGLQWAGGAESTTWWAITAGSPNAAEALAFVAFATDGARQGVLPVLGGVGPVVKSATEQLPESLLATSPSAPNNLAAGVSPDPGFWRDNDAKLTQRFEEWLKH